RQAERLSAGGERRALRRRRLQELPSAAQSAAQPHQANCRLGGGPAATAGECRRQALMITRRKMLVLLPAAAMAWEYVLAGTPESAPGYDRNQHWWGMLLDIDKCIGCGSCVRACANENDVPEGYFRTWVERYHVADWQQETPQVDSPNGGKNGFPASTATGGKNFFVPKMCNHCAHSPCTQVCPVGATF